ncbi:hypothetical protein UXA55_06455 [Aeromonas caviae]|jgi:S-adenosylmethionine hydrolase|uniref:hypothetical protein n=1 Tax=Aeromonas TaxID=642 RepID=UPI00191F4205|nr:hypothetical protein [Aeromonas caviae]MBL0450418.1 hypothetical protein [Aeromonas caviae]MDY7829228.1 hypothetical protein [Aeromonas caviae]
MADKLYTWVATPVEWLHSKFGSSSLSLDEEKAKTAAVIVDKDGNVQVNMQSEAFQRAFEQSVNELSRLRLDSSHKG